LKKLTFATPKELIRNFETKSFVQPLGCAT
jgi:hypothetical protein